MVVVVVAVAPVGLELGGLMLVWWDLVLRDRRGFERVRGQSIFDFVEGYD